MNILVALALSALIVPWVSPWVDRLIDALAERMSSQKRK